MDGVLSSESGEPIRAGVQLYYALNAGHRITLITGRTHDDADHWLKSHGIIGYDDLVDNSAHLEGEDLKKRQFLLSRSKVPLEMYIDSDPSMCAWAFEEQNVISLLFSSPGFARVENRPDAPSKVRKWADIEAAINRVNIARSEQALKPHEAELWSD